MRTVIAHPTTDTALLETNAGRRRVGQKARFVSGLESAITGASQLADATEIFWKTERCVMCEYILEVADRNIKCVGAARAACGRCPALTLASACLRSMPQWAHGGNGNFVGMTDFSGGIQQGAYRAYSGQYLQLEEGRGATPQSQPRARRELSSSVMALLELADSIERGPSTAAGSGLPDGAAPAPDAAEAAVVQRPSHRNRGDPTRFSAPTSPAAARKAASLRSLARRIHRSESIGAANPPAPSVLLEEEPEKDVIPLSPVKGRRTFQDFNRVDSSAEKSTEYGQMFDDLMDQLDDTCQNDIPKDHKGGQKACQGMLLNGEALTEYYLHGYEDWEICDRLNLCPNGFFDNA